MGEYNDDFDDDDADVDTYLQAYKAEQSVTSEAAKVKLEAAKATVATTAAETNVKAAQSRARKPRETHTGLSHTGQALRNLADGQALTDGESIIDHLIKALVMQLSRVLDLFREWDDDADGTVSEIEFRRALPMLGLKVERDVAERLFATFDEDRSGSISYEELHAKLGRRVTDVEIDAALKPGALGEIKLDAKNKFALRGGVLREGVSGVFGAQSKLIVGEGAPPVEEQLRNHLAKHLARVLDLFREWDEDADGTVSKREFRQCMSVLGLSDVTREDIDALFDTFDSDRSGSIDYRELSKRLRPPVGISRASSLPRLTDDSRGGAQAYKDALAAEVAAKRRLTRVQKELLRAASSASLEQKREERRLAKVAMKVEIDQRLGRDVSARLAAGTPASDDEVVEGARLVYKRMLAMFPGASWYKLFSLANDGSGRITYGELSRLLRNHLAMSKVVLPEAKLEGLWRALDDGCLGYLDAGAFGRFVNKGMGQLQQPATQSSSAQKNALGKTVESRTVSGVGLHGVIRAAVPADVPKADEEEVRVLAEQLTSKMSELYKASERSWIKVFKLVDGEQSGRLTYEQFLLMVRQHLKASVAEVSKAHLQSVWKAIDTEESGYIDVGEFGRFMKKGSGARATVEVSSVTEDLATRRRRAAEGERAARRLTAQRGEEDRMRVASRRAVALTKQMEMDADRLEAELMAIRRYGGKGTAKEKREMRTGRALPTLSAMGMRHGPDESGGSVLPGPAIPHVPPRSISHGLLLPPLRIGPGVDF